MALSGTIEGSIVNGNYKLRIVWTATQNISANTSTITAKLYLVQAASWSLNIGTRSTSYNSCTIAGYAHAFSTPAINNDGGATTLLATVSQIIGHNADGTRTAAIGGTFGIRATIRGTYYDSITASATVTLDTIARTSTFSASASSVAIGQSLTFSINRASSAFTHRLRYTLSGTSGTIATGVATSITWYLPIDLCHALPSSTSGNMVVYCDTYNGSTLIGTASLSVTATVPASVVPTITGAAMKEGGSGVPDGWGIYLAGISQLSVSVSASGAYGSTIAGYTCKVNNATYTAQTFTTGALTGSGEQILTVTVKDTRGRSSTKTYSYNVVSYSRPSIKAFTAKRVNANGADDDEGERVNVSATAQIYTANGKNSGTLTLAYKEATAADWVTIGTYPVTSTIDQTVTLSGFSIDSAFQFSATLTDALHTSALKADVSTATPTMDFRANGQGVAFGKVSEYDALECAMPARFTNTFYIAGGVNPAHTAGVTAVTSSDGAGKYVKLFSFPIATASAWNYSSLVLSFEECVFGLFSGMLDIHIRNNATTGDIAQKVFACHDCRGNPYHYNFYLVIANDIASVYWHCRSNYYGISVRVVNGYMPHAGFSGITWDGTTKTTTAPGGDLCAFMGGMQSSGVWRYRENADITREAWGRYEIGSAECTTALGSMYRTAVITLPDYPVAFASVPTVQISWTNAGSGALVWNTTEGTTTAPPTIYLVRPTSGIISGTVNIYAHGLK